MPSKQLINVITGARGQDGYFMAKSLKSSGESVFAIENKNYKHPEYLMDSLSKQNPYVDRYYLVDFNDEIELMLFIDSIKPSVIYNFAGFSSVAKSFLYPQDCFDINVIWFDRLLRAIRKSRFRDSVSIFQCSSSEMYAKSVDFIDESSELSPISPYGASKSVSHLLAKTYRDIYGLNVRAGILFNHESERRPDSFVFKSAIKQAVECHLGLSNRISIQNIDIERDWGFAGDYVEAMRLIMENGTSNEYVIATGIKKSVKEVILCALSILGVERKFEELIQIDSREVRESDHKGSIGNIRKIKRECSWTPKTTFESLVERITKHELAKFDIFTIKQI